MTLIEAILVPLMPTMNMFFFCCDNSGSRVQQGEVLQLMWSCDSCDLEWSDVILYQEYLNFIS